MNILFPYLARWRSANWSRYHGLLGALCQKGHRVWVLEPPPWPTSEETNYTETNVVLPAGMVVQQLQPPLWRYRLPMEKVAKKGLITLSARSALRDVIARNDIDLLMLYNLPQYVLAQIAPCVTVVDVADDLVAMLDHELGSVRRLGIHRLSRAMLDGLVQSSSMVTTPSTVLAERLGHATVVPNGVEWAASQRADGDRIRQRYRTPIVGFLGAFEYFVDFDVVLTAAEALPDVTFLLVGTGRSWKAVKARAQQAELANVVLPGPVHYPEGLDYVAAMDVCLIPFRRGPVSEGACPLKLFEYLALRKPVVSTSAEEIMRLGKGFIRFADTPAELVTVIRDILEDPTRMQDSVARGYERAQTRHRWDLIADEFLQLVEAVRAAT